MKYYKYLIFLSAITGLLSSTSCKRFLEQPSGSIVTVDSVFNTPDNAMRALWQTYATCVVNGFITGDGGSGLSDAGTVDGFMLAACDEGDQYGAGGRANAFNAGTWNATNTDEFSLSRVELGIRNANIFLENVGNVPFVSSAAYNWTPELRQQTIGEAKVLRAMMHYEAMIRFGGIPIINGVPKVDIVQENGINKAVVTPSAYRRSLKSTVDFIVKSCDEAAKDLPNAFPVSETGRITKGAALCLKAVTLMYSASPMVNTDKPALSYGNASDSLLCMGNTDPNRWAEAAAANKAVIDWALANGFALLDDAGLGKSESYNYATGAALDARNKEIILYDKSHGQQAGGANIVRWGCPIYYSWGNTVMALPMNFISKTYRDVAGNDVAIPNDGSFPEFKAIMKRMEPRFHAVAWWPGSQYTNTGLMNPFGGNDTAKFVYKQTSINGNFVQIGAGTALIGNGVPNGIHQKKFINLVNAANGNINAYWPIFRLPEFYLNYAEALNEINPANADIYTAINPIRARGGLPALAAGNATYNDIYGNQAKTRDYIRRERSVELYGEEHRFFDVRRWKIAGNEGVMKGQFTRFFLYQNSATAYVNPTTTMTAAARALNDSRLSYKVEPFETRVWEDKMYFFPFPQSEVNKGFLLQNPGW